jgi:hypothetical protein
MHVVHMPCMSCSCLHLAFSMGHPLSGATLPSRLTTVSLGSPRLPPSVPGACPCLSTLSPASVKAVYGCCMWLSVTTPGPSCYVEDDAGGPVLDASPAICSLLTGHSSCGFVCVCVRAQSLSVAPQAVKCMMPLLCLCHANPLVMFAPAGQTTSMSPWPVPLPPRSMAVRLVPSTSPTLSCWWVPENAPCCQNHCSVHLLCR